MRGFLNEMIFVLLHSFMLNKVSQSPTLFSS